MLLFLDLKQNFKYINSLLKWSITQHHHCHCALRWQPLIVPGQIHSRFSPVFLFAYFVCLFLLTVRMRCLFVFSFLFFSWPFEGGAVVSVPCSLLITCWEKANLLALLCVMFYCFYCYFRVRFWYLIVSIPDLCLPLRFVQTNWISNYLTLPSQP